jgi:hypothetical protein
MLRCRALFVLSLSASPVCAQKWSAIQLHVPGEFESEAFAIHGQEVGGRRRPSAGQFWGGTWNTATSTWTTLAQGGFVYGMSENVQVGAFGSYAAMWHDTPQSRIDLHPTGAYASRANAVHGNTQGGYVTYGGPGEPQLAAIWQGSAASMVLLHPSNAWYSEVRAVYGDQQGGYVQYQPTRYAAIWSGTAQSLVEINPPGFAGSQINGMAQGAQVGWAWRQGQGPTAGMWQGAAASYIDMHPFPAYGSSELFATTGAVHVGWSHVPGAPTFGNAGVWFGTDPFSFVDLHQFLPPGYGASRAYAVFQEGSTIYIGGTGRNPSGSQEAWMWVGVIPAPGAGATLVFAAAFATRRRRTTRR